MSAPEGSSAPGCCARSTGPSSWQFLGDAIADRAGRTASDIARTALAQLCEYILHLGEFEPARAAL
jgi:hypothetical protein